MIDRPSKIVMGIVIVGIVVSLAFSVWRFFIQKDYLMEYKTSCDPMVESCFSEVCEEGSLEEDCDTSPYKIVRKDTHDLYKTCGTDVRDCREAQVCLPTDVPCDVLYCIQEQLTEGVRCVGPADNLTEPQSTEYQ